MAAGYVPLGHCPGARPKIALDFSRLLIKSGSKIPPKEQLFMARQSNHITGKIKIRGSNDFRSTQFIIFQTLSKYRDSLTDCSSA